LLPQPNYGQTYQRQSATGYGQTQANCACQPQSQRLTQQQYQQQTLAQRSLYYRAASNYSRQDYNAQAYADSAAGQQQQQQQQQQQVQQQRYSVYFNPRTNQTILRPVGPATPQTANNSSLGNRYRQPATQPSVQGQAYVTPAVTQSQFDVARQRFVESPQPPVNNLSLNAPQPSAAYPVEAASPVVTTSFVEAATPAATPLPTGTLTTAPGNETTTPAESESPQRAFSILESEDSTSPGGLKLNN
jgi:hypothetical protein